MKIIDTDFQGWPIYAVTLRELLERLGIVEIGEGLLSIKNPELLDAYPITLEDDGMAYGIKQQYLTNDIDTEVYYDDELKENVFNIFRNGYRQTDSDCDS